MDRNERLRRNYKRLRDAGFSSAEASRLRGASEEKIRQAIKTRTMPMKDPYRQAAGKGQTADTIPRRVLEIWEREQRRKKGRRPSKVDIIGTPPTNIIKGHIKYEKSGTGDIPHYLSRYTYKIAYQVRHPNGSLEWKYITFTSHTKKYKYELWEELERLMSDRTISKKYDSQFVSGSAVLVGAYTR